jgi:adenylate cyclase, class 2
MIEHEAKVLDVDPRNVAGRILFAGGRYMGEGLQRRYVYDITPGDASRWIRLRQTPRETTLAVKVIHHDGIDGVEEVEVRVDDFERTHRLLRLQGFRAKAYQENRRATWHLGEDAEVTIDEWPGIPPYVEIEADSRHRVIEVACLLGFAEERLVTDNTIAVYARYGIDLAAITDLRFES